MKVISFDVGIKNMAYCILEVINNNIEIDSWGVLNLLNDEIATTYDCECMTNPKSKRALPKKCSKKAKYHKNDKYYCEKHAKENSQYMIPTNETTTSYLKKQKLDELIKIGNNNLIFLGIEDINKKRKPEIFEIIKNYYSTHCFNKIVKKKVKTANETDLISVGKSMKEQLNSLKNIEEVDNIVIENQISPIATRMKTIQGMLAQYFIMLNSNNNIEFVSSSHKLKQFSEFNLSNNEDNVSTSVNSNYKKHKKDGVYYSELMINANKNFNKWKEILNTKKKDDLADSFLQGIWYLKHNNNIIFADDLKINIV